MAEPTKRYRGNIYLLTVTKMTSKQFLHTKPANEAIETTTNIDIVTAVSTFYCALIHSRVLSFIMTSPIS